MRRLRPRLLVLMAAGLCVAGPAVASTKPSSTVPSWSKPFSLKAEAFGSANDDSRPIFGTAADGRGDLAVAWTEGSRSDSPHAPSHVELAVARAGGALTAAKVIYAHAGLFSSPQVAMDASGNLVVVFTQYASAAAARAVIAVPVSDNGQVGAPQQISAAGALAEDPSVAMAPNGAATIAYQGDGAFDNPPQFGGQEAGIPSQVMVAERGQGATSFGAPVAISAADPRAAQHVEGDSYPTVTMTSTGLATVLWLEEDSTVTSTTTDPGMLESAVASASGVFGSPVVVSDADYDQDLQVASDAGGDLAAMWMDPAGNLVGATATAGEAFSAPTVLLGSEMQFNISGTSVVLSPTGSALFLWSTGGNFQPGQLYTATWQPGGSITKGAAVIAHHPSGPYFADLMTPAAPDAVFSVGGRPLVSWQERRQNNEDPGSDDTSGVVTLEDSTGTSTSTLGAGQILVDHAYPSDSDTIGQLAGATLVGGGKGRVYEVAAVGSGAVIASRLLHLR